MTRVDLEAVERLLNEATPGLHDTELDDSFGKDTDTHRIVPRAFRRNRADSGSTARPRYIATVYTGADARLFAAAPTLIRALIEEVRGSKETIEQLTRERDDALVMLDARRKCQVIAEDEIERVRGERDEAHRRGMRDGFDLATEYDNNVRELGIDWTATENELDRRMSIPRASSAPSDKLSEEEL